jgi:hypothetical protein
LPERMDSTKTIIGGCSNSMPLAYTTFNRNRRNILAFVGAVPCSTRRRPSNLFGRSPSRQNTCAIARSDSQGWPVFGPPFLGGAKRPWRARARWQATWIGAGLLASGIETRQGGDGFGSVHESPTRRGTRKYLLEPGSRHTQNGANDVMGQILP